MNARPYSEVGLAGRKNGILLAAAEEAGFEVFVSLDKGLQYQQNLTGRRISVVIIRSRTNRLADVAPFIGACLEAMDKVRPGTVHRIEKS